MFLKKIKSLFRQVGFKMTMMHLLLIVLSSFFLFFFFYILYSQSLEEKDHEILQAKFAEYSTLYNVGGIKAIEEFLRKPQLMTLKYHADFFVRIESPDKSTLFFMPEMNSTVFNLREIEHGLYEMKEKQQWVYINTKRVEDDVEVLSMKMPNGDYLEVGKTVSDRDEVLDKFEESFIEILLVALLLGGFGGVILSNRMLRPIRELNTTLHSIDKGDDEARVPLSGSNDELEELASHFNQMLDRINSTNNAMRHTLDIVAHELRTPLTSVRGLAEVTLRKKNICEQDARAVLEDCVVGIDEILTEFKMLTDITEVESGLQNLRRENVDLGEICHDIIDLYEIVAEQKDISLTLNEEKSQGQIILNVDRKKIRQALANLVDNAIKYSPENSEITLTYYKENCKAVIKVKDQGIGIPQDELPNIWKRLYRGENARKEKGIGLGLSLVKSIVEAHNGNVEVETMPGKGSVFFIRLPL